MRRIAMVALVMAMTGCTVDATGPSGSVVGDYTLTRVNGQQLPYTLSPGLVLVREDLSLYSDGTYSDVSTYSSGSNRQESGYYRDTNGSLVFQSNFGSGAVYQGSVSGRVLTEIVGGYTQTFEKR